MSVEVRFADAAFAPVQLDPGLSLFDVLTASNSPMLFGCRTGICATCLCTLVAGTADPPDAEELELLDLVAEGNPKARLACQLKPQSDVVIAPLEET